MLEKVGVCLIELELSTIECSICNFVGYLIGTKHEIKQKIYNAIMCKQKVVLFSEGQEKHEAKKDISKNQCLEDKIDVLSHS